MLSTNPYLNFTGDSELALNFYRSVFGGDFTHILRYRDMPGNEKMAAEDQDKVINITLTIQDGISFMATDVLPSTNQELVSGNNFHININAESEAEADKIFPLLAEGGKIKMPLNKTFWGGYFGMCTDKFGISWMINYTYPQKS